MWLLRLYKIKQVEKRGQKITLNRLILLSFFSDINVLSLYVFLLLINILHENQRLLITFAFLKSYIL